MPRFILPAFLLLVHAVLRAQDPSGVWEGNLLHSTCTSVSSNWKTEIELFAGQGKVTGQVRFVHQGDFQINRITHVFNYSGTISGDEIEILFYAREQRNHRRKRSFENYYTRGRYTLRLLYERCGGRDVITGTFRGSNGGRGKLLLARKGNRDDIGMLAQRIRFACADNPLPANNPLPSPVKLETRRDSVQHRILLTDSVYRLLLYDNGEVDNDTVSVYINDSLVVYRQRLQQRPLVIPLTGFTGSSFRLRMLAHNEGDIPPNTALLRVETGSGRQELTLSADLRVNSLVIFERAKSP